MEQAELIPKKVRDCAWCGAPSETKYKRRGATITDDWCLRHYSMIRDAEAEQDAAKAEARMVARGTVVKDDSKMKDLAKSILER